MEIERYAAPLPPTVRELAERLLMDRSTLGHNLQIRDLEYEVGVQLMSRSSTAAFHGAFVKVPGASIHAPPAGSAKK